MRPRRALAGCLAALSVSGAGLGAATADAQPSAVVHRLVLTTQHGRLAADGGLQVSTSATPAIALPTRAAVTFTVARKTLLLPFSSDLPKAAGRYAAYYFPAAQEAWALLPDVGSTQHWPAVLTLEGAFATLYPHHRYTVFVALEHAATVRMPVPMHVVKVHPVSFAVGFVVHPVSLAAPASVATLDWTNDKLGRFALSSTAIALDWDDDPAPVESTQGDACHATSQVGSCSDGSNLAYFSQTSELGLVGGPQQVVMGRGYDRRVSATYISGYAANAPTPFNAATLYGFAMNPPTT